MLLAGAAATASSTFAAAASDDHAFFEAKIRPLFAQHCYECHGEKKQKGGLRLDSRAAWQEGGDSGAVIIPGKPDESPLIQAVRYADEDLQMPPKQRLAPAEVALLAEWVRRGAPDPREAPAGAAASGPRRPTLEAARAQWPFTPLAKPAIPAAAAGVAPIDAFVRAKLAVHNLTPAPRAEPRTLIRRLTFNLTGLPPTPGEVAAFESDSVRNPESAIPDLVDRLLASPRHGERFARHWLDVVRYVDGYERINHLETEMNQIWRYRDWVVRAFNADLPYDEFVVHQLAGDLLMRERGDAAWSPDGLIATGVLLLGEWGRDESDLRKQQLDIVDDQIDLTSKAFLGLTVSCARCHDHKFDAISQRDYTAMAGVFFSTGIFPFLPDKTSSPDMNHVPLLPPARFDAHVAAEAELKQLADERARLQEKILRDLIRDAWPRLPAYFAAAFDVAQRPEPERRLPETIATVAAQHGLDAHQLRQCATFLALAPEGKPAPPRKRFIVKRPLLIAGSHLAGWIDAARAADRAAAAGHARALLALALERADELVAEVAKTVLRRRTAPVFAHPDADLFEELSNPEAGLLMPSGGIERAADAAAAARLAALAERTAAVRGRMEKDVTLANAVREGGVPEGGYAGFHDARLHSRGSYETLGAVVPRGAPALLTAHHPSPAIPAGTSGRLQLARWIADAKNPLTARVIANRVWQWHFGRALVPSANNFGLQRTAPSNPELLDYLATRLIGHGWSLKKLHRDIVLSETYLQSSHPPPDTFARDPDNEHLGWMPRRRLEAEALRDAILAASGELDGARFGPPILPEGAAVPKADDDDAAESAAKPTVASGPATAKQRRTLYLATTRRDRSGFRVVFDAPDNKAPQGGRAESTVAPQALYLLNDPFVLRQAAAIAARVAREAGDDDTARLRWLHATLFARPPSAGEIAIARETLPALAVEKSAAWTQFTHVLLASNESIYVD